MGVDKVLEKLEGVPLVLRAIRVVGEVCSHTMVVTNRVEALSKLDLPEDVLVRTDEVPYQGPLGGLVTALAEAPDEWVLAVAADMPYLTGQVVRQLWSAREGADVVVPIGEKGPEPLLALYSRTCLPAARRSLDSGRRRLVSFFRNVRVAEVPIESLRDVDPHLSSFVNVNTPEELAAARKESGLSPAGGRFVSTGSAGDTSTKLLPTADGKPRGRGAVSVVHAGTGSRRGQPIESPTTIFLNDEEVATLQATPADLDELAAGFLVGEGFLSSRGALRFIDVDYNRGLVYVSTEEAAPDEARLRKRSITSGCGKGVTFSSIGHARGLAPVESDLRVAAESLRDMMSAMSRAAKAYRQTGGMHACGLARSGTDAKGLVVREDVGRHNALDKVLGRAWLDGFGLGETVVLTTGRISYEMAVKAAKGGIPLVVSRTAVTNMASDIAAALDITLVGYARGGSLTVYTHPQRILTGDCSKG